jgi:hypothetical protein
MAIPCYIPSKDRPAQLHLLLRSLEKNASGLFKPTVVYTASNQDFINGYEKSIDGPVNYDIDIEWKYEYSSGEQFYDFLNKNSGDLVCLFSDDCIFYRPTNISEKSLRRYFKNEDLWTFTYRLGKNISIRDYVINRPTSLPEINNEDDKLFMWDWSKGDFWDIMYFTVGFDGYVYRADDLLSLSNQEPLHLNRICFWEKLVCEKFNSNPPARKLMAAPLQSNVFVQQINTTHEYGHRTNNKFNISTEHLNKEWLSGKEINLDSLNFSNINCTHGELKFEYSFNRR